MRHSVAFVILALVCVACDKQEPPSALRESAMEARTYKELQGPLDDLVEHLASASDADQKEAVEAIIEVARRLEGGWDDNPGGREFEQVLLALYSQVAEQADSQPSAVVKLLTTLEPPPSEFDRFDAWRNGVRLSGLLVIAGVIDIIQTDDQARGVGWLSETTLVAATDGGGMVWGIEAVAPDFVKVHEKGTFAAHPARTRSMAVIPGRQWVVTGDMGGTVYVWDANTQDIVRELPGHRSAINVIAVSGDEKRIATAGHEGILRLWDVQDLSLSQEIVTETESIVFALAFSDDGGTLFSGGKERALSAWDVSSGEPVWSVPYGPMDWIMDITCDAAGQRVLVSSNERIRAFDLVTLQATVELKTPRATGDINAIALLPNHRYLLSGGDVDCVVRMWDLEAKQEVWQSLWVSGSVGELAVSPSGTIVAVAAGPAIWLLKVPPGPTPP